jgi:hypothetical protein
LISQNELSLLYSFLDAVRSAPERVESFRRTALKGDPSEEYRQAVDAIVGLVQAIPEPERRRGDEFRSLINAKAKELQEGGGQEEAQRIAAGAILLAMR